MLKNKTESKKSNSNAKTQVGKENESPSQFVDNRRETLVQRAIQDMANKSDKTNSPFKQPISMQRRRVAQMGGSMHYWVVEQGGGGNKQYVKTFKSHAAASKWWNANKSSYVGYTFGRGSSKEKYR